MKKGVVLALAANAEPDMQKVMFHGHLMKIAHTALFAQRIKTIINDMETKKYRIYLDVCCLNRPFDDLSNDRLRMEADAVLAILSRCKNGVWALLTSDVIKQEISRQTDTLRREKVEAFLSTAIEDLKTTEVAVAKAVSFQKNGIKVFDSYHLAVADENSCDVFLTTDDRFLNKATRQKINTRVANPATWLLEVI
ncbi:MAG: PIN domain-containing protein [Acidobacteriota bacterium]|jgi:predicted nucleic acid-binding protein|nr:PIN domain-containing protein [Acidobacteriota bacterium]